MADAGDLAAAHSNSRLVPTGAWGGVNYSVQFINERFSAGKAAQRFEGIPFAVVLRP